MIKIIILSLVILSGNVAFTDEPPLDDVQLQEKLDACNSLFAEYNQLFCRYKAPELLLDTIKTCGEWFPSEREAVCLLHSRNNNLPRNKIRSCSRFSLAVIPCLRDYAANLPVEKTNACSWVSSTNEETCLRDYARHLPADKIEACGRWFFPDNQIPCLDRANNLSVDKIIVCGKFVPLKVNQIPCLGGYKGYFNDYLPEGLESR